MEVARTPRVIVGVNGSFANLEALRASVDYARHLGAELIAVRAWLPAGGEIAYRRGPCPPLLELWRQRACDTLTTAFADALGGPPSDLSVRCVTGRGETGPVLVAAADQPHDLLVLGTGHLGLITRRRPGAISRYCLRRADCPVLIVPPPEIIRTLRSRRGLDHSVFPQVTAGRPSR